MQSVTAIMIEAEKEYLSEDKMRAMCEDDDFNQVADVGEI